MSILDSSRRSGSIEAFLPMVLQDPSKLDVSTEHICTSPNSPSVGNGSDPASKDLEA
jgi:hypothetical protein